MVKMTKFLRILKLVKIREKIKEYFKSLFNMKDGVDKIFFIVIIILVLCHIFSCMWFFFIKNFNYENVDDNWITRYSLMSYN